VGGHGECGVQAYTGVWGQSPQQGSGAELSHIQGGPKNQREVLRMNVAESWGYNTGWVKKVSCCTVIGISKARQ